MEQRYTFEQLWEIVETLRGEDGCSWDRVQTHESLIPCMVEEAYEVVDAIRMLGQGGGPDGLCEELGDVLLQVVFHSQLAQEEGLFTFQDVTDKVAGKMVHRHPHVFGEAGNVRPDWDTLKREEKGPQTPMEEINSVPHALPALIRTAKILKKMDKYYGCERDPQASLDSVKEQIKALENRQNCQNMEDIENRLGEAFFQLCNYARLNGINSEMLLEKTLEKHLKNHEMR